MEMSGFSEIPSAEKGERTTREEWEEIFELLDTKDGQSDGYIHRDTFLEWIDTLSFQDSISLEADRGISRGKLKNLLESADADHNNFIDKLEFLALIERHSGELERIQQSRLLQFMRVAAYAEEYSWWPPPLFTLSLILFNVAIYISHVIHFVQQGREIDARGPVPLCSVLIFNSDLRHEAWRYIGYSFVHAGMEHIIVNMALMILVGIPLEMTNSWWRVALVYSIGVVSGSLCFAVTSQGVFLAGASGGVYALACAHMATLLLNWREDSLILRQRLSNNKASAPVFGKVVRLARLLVVMGILSVDIITSLVNSGPSSTSYEAHLSGSVMGVVVGVVILKNRRVQHWEVWLRAGCCVLAGGLLLVGVIANIVYVQTVRNEFKCEHFIA